MFSSKYTEEKAVYHEKMINELDPNLLKIIFKHESKEAAKETFLL
jgi:succinate dehydrogenase flavin-adding protein (antitoxin of CptAB toxin-antitoxin module)